MTKAVARKNLDVPTELARATRDDAAAHRGLAQALLRAELAADWKGVADVRTLLVEISLGLEELAERLERK